MANYMTELPNDAQQVPNALAWATPDGNLYGIETRFVPVGNEHIKTKNKHYGEYFRYQKVVNRHNGYVYVPVKYINSDGTYIMKQRRLHILIAEVFIPNPFGLPIVGHKNNIKTDCKASNLYWTTHQENTQKAFDDGLATNDKGYDDSQSIPVVMFDSRTNKELGRYGSASEATRVTGISKNTILRQCRYNKPVRKPFYFRFQSDERVTPPRAVVQRDFFTDEIIGVFYNIGDAANKTGISTRTISQQCCNGRKPKRVSKSRTYFLYREQIDQQ